MSNSELLIYESQTGDIKIDVRLEEETVWLTQAQLCQLFQKSKATISEHIKNVFEEGELEPGATVRKFRTVQTEGSREVERETEHYNLDVVISQHPGSCLTNRKQTSSWFVRHEPWRE